MKSFKLPKLKMLALKTQSRTEPIQSRKWSEILKNFIDQIPCLKTDYLAKRYSPASENK